MECALCHPRLGLAEVVGTVVGDQAPGLIKGPHKGRLQGPFLSGCQVFFQLLQAGRAQGDRIPVGALQGKTARHHAVMPRRDPVTHTPAQPRLCQDLGASICVCSVPWPCLTLIPWTVAHLAPLSMECFRQKYRSRLPFPLPGCLSNSGIEPKYLAFPALAGRFFTTELPGSPQCPYPALFQKELAFKQLQSPASLDTHGQA